MTIRPFAGRFGLCAALLLTVSASTRAGAQQIDACYVPTVGAIYLINRTGLPTACLATSHVTIGWTSGVVAHGDLTGLDGDDHPQYLLADGARPSNGFAVTGSLGTGTLAATGLGERLVWYPAKAAFRAGSVDGTQWDDASIGTFSAAMGVGTLASGSAAWAMGYNTTASAANASAMGQGTVASGIRSTALGYITTASGSNATAMGQATTASGTNSTAMGQATTASASMATAMGYLTTASGSYSTAMGGSTTASNEFATALGSFTTASGFASTAMGEFNTAQAYGSVVIGHYNVVAGDATQWLSTDPLLVAGNGTSEVTTSNALTLYKNGNMTIAGTLTESSDARLKDDVEPLESALDGVLRLTPIRYRFREGTGHPAERQIGLSAQEVQPVFPELVSEDARGYLSLAYPNLTAVLVRAIQEQQAQIARLEAQVAELRAALAR